MVYFDSLTMAFIPAHWKDDGTYNEQTWPCNAVLLTPQEQATYWRQPAPDGKKLGTADGRPVWVELPEVEPRYKKQFSVLEFRDRFTIDEQLAIRQAQFNDMEVGLVYDAFQAAQFIDVRDPRVEQGVDLYIAKGLLEPERKAKLLEPELIN